jgi:CHAD domain-containing protein
MAYHFKRNESIPEAARRIAQEELESACAVLSGPGRDDRDEDIHEARKSVKKVRALLRLLQPELGDVYAKENRRLGSAGRKISAFRDAGAILEVFDQLKKNSGDEWRPRELDPIRRKLVERKKRAEADTDIDESLRSVGDSLCKAGKRVKRWPLQTDGFPAIESGLENVFRSGRKAFAWLQKHPRPENYHEWRKRVKDHWYHVRLLESLWTDVMQAYEKSLKDLETWLGDDHNLVLLREIIIAEPGALGTDDSIDLFLRLLDKHQKELRENALAMGKRVYEVKPAQFTRRMKQLWGDWQTQPKTLENAQ